MSARVPMSAWARPGPDRENPYVIMFNASISKSTDLGLTIDVVSRSSLSCRKVGISSLAFVSRADRSQESVGQV
uniref:Uncharacterized protein n=1 Tax=Romanomermis culicivorax TaxID=13658 RepID=A0A915IH35_ROMCU